MHYFDLSDKVESFQKTYKAIFDTNLLIFSNSKFCAMLHLNKIEQRIFCQRLIFFLGALPLIEKKNKQKMQ